MRTRIKIDSVPSSIDSHVKEKHSGSRVDAFVETGTRPRGLTSPELNGLVSVGAFSIIMTLKAFGLRSLEIGAPGKTFSGTGIGEGEKLLATIMNLFPRIVGIHVKVPIG